MQVSPFRVTCVVTAAAVCGCSSPHPPATATPATKPVVLSTGDVCKLSPEQLAARRQELIPGLFRRAEQVIDIENGLRFQFTNKPGLLTDLFRVIEQEQDCCSFLRFVLTIEPNAGLVSLAVTGPAGTADMLRKL